MILKLFAVFFGVDNKAYFIIGKGGAVVSAADSVLIIARLIVRV